MLRTARVQAAHGPRKAWSKHTHKSSAMTALFAVAMLDLQHVLSKGGRGGLAERFSQASRLATATKKNISVFFFLIARPARCRDHGLAGAIVSCQACLANYIAPRFYSALFSYERRVLRAPDSPFFFVSPAPSHRLTALDGERTHTHTPHPNAFTATTVRRSARGALRATTSPRSAGGSRPRPT